MVRLSTFLFERETEAGTDDVVSVRLNVSTVVLVVGFLVLITDRGVDCRRHLLRSCLFSFSFLFSA